MTSSSANLNQPYRKARAKEARFEPTTTYLADRGVTPAYAEHAGVEVSRGAGSPFVIPYHEPDGRPLQVKGSGGRRVKFHVTRVWDNPARKFKQPANTPSQLYLAPVPGQNLKAWCDDPGTPLLVTEGPVKAMALAQHGHFAVAISGCWNWQKKGKGPLPAWKDWFKFKGRQVYLVFDADVEHNPDNARAVFELRAFLLGEGADVRVCLVPPVDGDDKAGVDDYLVEHGPDALQKLLEQATTDADALKVPLCPEDVLFHMANNDYVYRPTGELLPATTVRKLLGAKTERLVNLRQAVNDITWAPDKRFEIIEGQALVDGGWTSIPDHRTYNRFQRAPQEPRRSAGDVKPWLDHGKKLLGEHWLDVLHWFAYAVQNPGEKINHGLVLGSPPGGGKDSLLAPVLRAVGSANARTISAQTLLDEFNGFAQSVLLQVSEARDLGDKNRVPFYERFKDYLAAPPETLMVNQKHTKPYWIPNVVKVVLTTNHRTGALFLPPDDRRHLVVWSQLDGQQLGSRYFKDLWAWYHDGGFKAVAGYLAHLDTKAFKEFDPYASPLKTEAFWAMVEAERPLEESELGAAIEELGNPNALTLPMLRGPAKENDLRALLALLEDTRHSGKNLGHQLERAGYLRLKNPNSKAGLWRVPRGEKNNKTNRTTVFVKSSLPTKQQQYAAAQRLTRGQK